MARLTRARWIEEGLVTLQEDGPPALAADRMAKRLGVSRGSFYWHFANAMDFAAAVLAEWENRWTNRVIETVEAIGGSAHGRLHALIEKTGGQDASIYASAKRMAQQDSAVRKMMQGVDERRVTFVIALLVDGGVNEKDASARGQIIYAWAIGQMLISGDRPVPEEVARTLVEFGFAGARL